METLEILYAVVIAANAVLWPAVIFKFYKKMKLKEEQEGSV